MGEVHLRSRLSLLGLQDEDLLYVCRVEVAVYTHSQTCAVVKQVCVCVCVYVYIYIYIHTHTQLSLVVIIYIHIHTKLNSVAIQTPTHWILIDYSMATQPVS